MPPRFHKRNLKQGNKALRGRLASAVALAAKLKRKRQSDAVVLDGFMQDLGIAASLFSRIGPTPVR